MGILCCNLCCERVGVHMNCQLYDRAYKHSTCLPADLGARVSNARLGVISGDCMLEADRLGNTPAT